MQTLSEAERARLDWDFEQGNPAFVGIKKWPGHVVGVHLDKIDRLVLVETSGKWSTASKKPPEVI